MAVTRREMLTGCAILAVAPVPAGHPIEGRGELVCTAEGHTRVGVWQTDVMAEQRALALAGPYAKVVEL